MTVRLPALVRVARNPLVYLLVWAPYIAAYQLANRFPLRAPQELPFTRLDEAIPFVGALLPLYVAYLPLYWWTVARSETDRELNRLFYVTHLQLLLSLPVFLLLPVRMPRERFYPAGALGWADAFWRWFDPPQNCFPSLHVANCLALLGFNWRRPWRGAHTLATLGVIGSTVFVKQHYVVDVLGGVLVFLASWGFFRRLEITGVDPAGWIADAERQAPAGGRGWHGGGG